MTLIRNRQPVQTVPKQRPKVQCTIWTLGGSAKIPLICFSIAQQKVFRFQCAPSQASFSVCPCPKRSFLPARIQKHPFKLVCTQSVSRVRPNPKRPFAIICIQGTPLLWSSPKRPFALACIQIALLSLPAPKAPSCPPESKTALRGCLNPRLPFTITCTQSPSCHPGSKDPPRVRPSLKHPSCSPKS